MSILNLSSYVVEIIDVSQGRSAPVQWYRGRKPHTTWTKGEKIFFGSPEVVIPHQIMGISYSRRTALLRWGYVYTTHVDVKPLVGHLSGLRTGS